MRFLTTFGMTIACVEYRGVLLRKFLEQNAQVPKMLCCHSECSLPARSRFGKGRRSEMRNLPNRSIDKNLSRNA